MWPGVLLAPVVPGTMMTSGDEDAGRRVIRSNGFAAPWLANRTVLMRFRALIRLCFTTALAACLMGGCRCGRDIAVSDDDPEIDKPDLITEFPGVPRPETIFPAHLRQEDPSLNKFIEQVLDVCARGDYDAYRQLFGTAYPPTPENQFRKVWPGVKSAEVIRIERGKDHMDQEPRYFVLARVHVQTEARGLEARSVPVMVFKEGGEWRVGQAPKKEIERLRALESQPAAASELTSRPK